MKLAWWKMLAIFLAAFAIIGGFLIKVPALPILHETIRNLYFHVTMWFSMIILLLFSLIASIKTLSGKQPHQDIVAAELAKVGTFMGILGVLTGSLWARFTWGDWWVSDAKLNGAAITLLFYFAYLILRSSIEDPEKRARIAAVYNIFAYVMLVVFLMVLPRMTDSLHPGNGGNPGFGGYDLDNTMKIVFYPAILGWTLLGAWLANLGIRYQKLKNEMDQSF